MDAQFENGKRMTVFQEKLVARIYGGILGIVALTATIFRGWIHGSDPESTLWFAWLHLIFFAAVGIIIGWIAEMTIEQSVQVRLAEEIREKQKEELKSSS
jgi:hypothetical protein